MRLLALFIAGLLAAAPLTSQADDAASLLAKHRAFVGWQFGDGTFTSLDLDGDIGDQQRDGTLKKLYTLHEIESGVVFHTDVTNLKRGTTYHEGFTGHIYWTTDENGFTRPELGDVPKYNLSYDLLRNEATPEMTGTLQGTAQVDGTQTQIVRVSDPNAYPLDLYVDPATGAYKRAVIDPGGTYETTVNILAYTDALPGKKVMSKVIFGEGTGASYTEYTKIQANVPVTADEMHPPKPVAYWTFGSGAPAPVRLTQYRIYVQATINGVPGNFIFDTGAGSGILLTQDFANRAHVKASGSTVGYGIGGSAKESVGHIDTMQIGDSVLHDAVVSTQDLGYHWQQESGVPYAPDGIIGFSLLAGAIVSLNLDAGTMIVQDPSTAIDQSKGLVANVDLSGGIPRLPMKIDDVQVNASLDTGNAGYVLYSPELHSRYGVRTMVSTGIMQGTYDTQVVMSGGYIGGIGGVSAADCGTIDNISLGPIVYTNVAACQTQEWSGREILVGIDFLRHFNYVFDYPHAQLVIMPRKSDN